MHLYSLLQFVVLLGRSVMQPLEFRARLKFQELGPLAAFLLLPVLVIILLLILTPPPLVPSLLSNQPVHTLNLGDVMTLTCHQSWEKQCKNFLLMKDIPVTLWITNNVHQERYHSKCDSCYRADCHTWRYTSILLVLPLDLLCPGLVIIRALLFFIFTGSTFCLLSQSAQQTRVTWLGAYLQKSKICCEVLQRLKLTPASLPNEGQKPTGQTNILLITF